jgi:copper homeostasis protein
MQAIEFEVPVFGAATASRAVDLGASRIELNAEGSYPEGGLTPSLAELRAIAGLGVPIRVMIRPRGPPAVPARDFFYSNEELDEMQGDVERFKATGLLRSERGDGFVFGVLKEYQTPQHGVVEGSPRENPATFDPVSHNDATRRADNDTAAAKVSVTPARCRVDVRQCRRLVEAASPFKAIFHRAFDEIVGTKRSDTCQAALNDLSTCGFSGVLTSGGPGSAVQNVAALKSIIQLAQTTGIEVIIGGGLRKSNAGILIEELSLRNQTSSICMHSSCLADGSTASLDPNEVTGITSLLR